MSPSLASPGPSSPGARSLSRPLSADEAVAALTAASAPFLIGVRHHAPSLAAAVPALLDGAAPDVLLVELPAEMQEWLPWLGHAETRAPVALAAACAEEGAGPAFYPFADFSPELAAVRWACRQGVPVVACDLPLADRAWREGTLSGPRVPRPGSAPDTAPGDRTASGTSTAPETGSAPVSGTAPTVPEPGRAGGVDPDRAGLTTALRARLTGRPGEDLWDRLVEATAPGSGPEALRRAALLTGWALREEAAASTGVPGLDLRREAWMRSRLAAATADGARAALVVGAFHAPALLSPATAAGPGGGGSVTPGQRAAGAAAADGPGWVTSLIPYTYALLDERSGYPAGIRDPEWQHLVLRTAGDPGALEEALAHAAVRVCAALRDLGHPSGPADAREIVRLASDLARLRGLPVAGRGELVEAVQTVLAQGEPYGRGRAVARAMEQVLVGTRSGRPAPGAPRSGLAPAVEAELAALGLPGPASADSGTRGTNGAARGTLASGTTGPAGTVRELRLDPLRSGLDRARDLLLRRLTVCGVPYAEARGVVGTGGAETLTTRWEVRWTPATEAMLSAVGVHGVTPAQAAEGVLRERWRAERDDGGPTAAQTLDGLRQAAECGLPELADARLAETADVLPGAATLPELLDGLGLLDRLRAGHVPGLGADEDRALRAGAVAELLTAAAVRQVDGLGGAEDPADAHALLELAHRADVLGGVRLTDALARLAREGSPLMRGAAGAVRVLLGHEDPDVLGERAASWVDAARDRASRAALTARLTGLLTAAGPLLESAAPALEPLLDRVSELADREFLDRLPALRGGFDTLSPAARDRLLSVVEERLDVDRTGDTGGVDPAALALWTRADLAARTLLGGLGLLPAAAVPGGAAADEPDRDDGAAPVAAALVAAPDAGAADRHLDPEDRWRLVLGRRTDRLSPAAAAPATALDELYGSGRGEGSRGDATGPGRIGAGGGREASYPSVREWSQELAVLFGPGVREEVLAAAASSGRPDVLAELDPDGVRPSVDLLRTVLRHAGGLPEARLAALRPLVRRLVEGLTRELATRLRPALHGTVVPRPSRRPGGGLDLPRTLRANLASAHRGPDGTVRVVPEHPVFRTRARRAADWRLVLVTDVSGSMEASTVWAALTASVLAGVPTLSTHFLAFSTEVMDLTDHVHDPLSLLLEVSVGGGTHIAAGLRHARTLVTVPSRTLVVVVSDFEEGFPLGGLLAEVRALVGSGCHVLGCASLDDAGRPRYSTGVAGQLVAAGMPVAALSPLELARWVGEKIA
ncbi:vWA domain-containing protein [Streptomyces ardesiacus]|uniref:vWA domain-containing protein n=1 Tax=Streptomyces ardesiacus TaxID=285564 RepID=UPI00380ABB2E